MIKDSTILITGGAGFIGTALIKKIIAKNKIIVYDSFKRDSLRYTDLIANPNLVVVQGDILDCNNLKNTVEKYKPEYILHMAAVAGIDSVIKSPTITMEVNIIGTNNVLRTLKPYMKRMKRFIDFSTSEVSGVHSFRVSEDAATSLQPVGEARWTYAISKLAGEHLSNAYFKEFGFPVVIVRPFNIYGPGQVGEGAVHDFIKLAVEEKNLEVHGDGSQIRAWCYIDDILKGILLCLEKEEAVGHVFNIGNPGSTVTILELAKKIIYLAKSKSKVVHVPKTYVDVELRIPNIDKIRSVLGYEPEFDLDDGLLETIKWYRNNSK